MADQPVEIVDYDPGWVDLFERERDRLSVLLAPWLAGPVEHIGSTAVTGLAAKPVVDVLAPVRSLAEARAAVDPLVADGWMFWPEDPCAHYRLWFLRPRPQARTHHLHLLRGDDIHATALRTFRDALRADPTLRDGYAGLKRESAIAHPHSRNAYTNAKADFVDEVLRAAGVAVPRRDPLPE